MTNSPFLIIIKVKRDCYHCEFNFFTEKRFSFLPLLLQKLSKKFFRVDNFIMRSILNLYDSFAHNVSYVKFISIIFNITFENRICDLFTNKPSDPVKVTIRVRMRVLFGFFTNDESCFFFDPSDIGRSKSVTFGIRNYLDCSIFVNC